MCTPLRLYEASLFKMHKLYMHILLLLMVFCFSTVVVTCQETQQSTSKGSEDDY